MKAVIRTSMLTLGLAVLASVLAPIPASAGCGAMTCAAVHDNSTLKRGDVLEASDGEILKWTCEYQDGTVLTISCETPQHPV